MAKAEEAFLKRANQYVAKIIRPKVERMVHQAIAKELRRNALFYSISPREKVSGKRGIYDGLTGQKVGSVSLAVIARSVTTDILLSFEGFRARDRRDSIDYGRIEKAVREALRKQFGG